LLASKAAVGRAGLAPSSTTPSLRVDLKRTTLQHGYQVPGQHESGTHGTTKVAANNRVLWRDAPSPLLLVVIPAITTLPGTELCESQLVPKQP
jgi:hypothetical protein